MRSRHWWTSHIRGLGRIRCQALRAHLRFRTHPLRLAYKTLIGLFVQLCDGIHLTFCGSLSGADSRTSFSRFHRSQNRSSNSIRVVVDGSAVLGDAQKISSLNEHFSSVGEEGKCNKLRRWSPFRCSELPLLQ